MRARIEHAFLCMKLFFASKGAFVIFDALLNNPLSVLMSQNLIDNRGFTLK